MTEADSIRELKKKQRRIALEARRKLSVRDRGESEQRVFAFLAEMPELQQAGTILSYLATKEELSLSMVHNWAQQIGKRVAFPVSYPGGKMDAYIPLVSENLRKGPLGIAEPAPETSVLVQPEEIDVVLVPCVAFDSEGRRLGHGGGYYDRYLPGCANARIILVAYEAQRIPCVTADALDVNMSILVTEAGVSYTGLSTRSEGI